MEKTYTRKQLLRRHIVCTLFKLILLLAALWVLQETTNGVDYVSMMSLYYWLPILCAAVLWGLCRDVSSFVTLLRHRDLTGNRKTVRALYPKKLKVLLNIPPVLFALVFIFGSYSEVYFGFFHQNAKTPELLQRFALDNYTDYTYAESSPTFQWGGDEYEFYSVYLLNWSESYDYGIAKTDDTEQEQGNAGGRVSILYMDHVPQWLADREYAEARDAEVHIYSFPDYTAEDVQMHNTRHPLEIDGCTGFWRQIPRETGQEYCVTLLGENRFLDLWLSINSGEIDLEKLIEEATAQMQAP